MIIDSFRVRVELGARGYDVVIGTNLDIFQLLLPYRGGLSALVVTNDKVGPIYLQDLVKSLEGIYQKVLTITVPDGEIYKNWETLNLIYDVLLKNDCDRKTVLFALGGGVVGDITGFAAASYMRGVPFIQVPTTLLSQVDSSVGGKTGINHPLGKNMIGAFHQPNLVICDIGMLKTLPDRELSAGFAEIIKYGPIFDMEFFAWLETAMPRLLAKNVLDLAYAVRRSCEIKAEVVGEDERESGARAILNFGHTFGHAIESGLGYGVWLHGEGVAAGMVMAAELSYRLGLVEESFVSRLRRLIERAGLPVKGAILDSFDNAGRYLQLMKIDKKSDAGDIRFVLIEEPGKAIVRAAPEALVREVIEACCA